MAKALHGLCQPSGLHEQLQEDSSSESDVPRGRAGSTSPLLGQVPKGHLMKNSMDLGGLQQTGTSLVGRSMPLETGYPESDPSHFTTTGMDANMNITNHVKQESGLGLTQGLKNCFLPSDSMYSNSLRSSWNGRQMFSPNSSLSEDVSAQNNTGFTRPIGHTGWNDVARSQPLGLQQYSTPPSAHARHLGHNPPYSWQNGSTNTSSHFGYGMHPMQGAYRPQTEGGSVMYPYSTPYSGGQNGFVHDENKSSNASPTLQELDAERTIRRARRNRTCFSKHQLEKLEDVFRQHRYPDVYRREEIASELDLKEEVVRVWFKNRRAKLKRDSKDLKGMSTPPSESSLPSPTKTSPNPFPVAMYPSTFPNGTSYPSFGIKPETSQPYYPPAPYGFQSSLTQEAVSAHTTMTSHRLALSTENGHPEMRTDSLKPSEYTESLKREHSATPDQLENRSDSKVSDTSEN